jgi:hypothetical protein
MTGVSGISRGNVGAAARKQRLLYQGSFSMALGIARGDGGAAARKQRLLYQGSFSMALGIRPPLANGFHGLVARTLAAAYNRNRLHLFGVYDF